MKKLCVQNDPFLLIEEGHLSIKTKSGELIPLVLNKAQRRLHNKIKSLWNDNKIIRIIVLKARQLGISTYIEALIYAITSQCHNINSLVIADNKDGSNYIFEMSKLYQEKLPIYLRPDTRKSNEKKLEFEGTHSQILIDTAENAEAGRKMTLRCVHLSEKAFFPKRNADDIMLGLSHSVPPLPRTVIIQETTANGFNFFKDEWDKAVDGETDYIPIFIPWYWGEDYMMDMPENFELGDPSLGDITKEEIELYNQMEVEGIDFIEERLTWRRWDIRNNCKGDVEHFKQENPSTPEEAFIASGQCFFDKKQLTNQLKRAKPPIYKASIVKEDFKFKIRKHTDGEFSFWEEIHPYNQYVVSGDACSGSGEDYAWLVARNKETNSVAVTMKAKIDPDELAYRAYLLASYLNECKTGIENDKFGFAANEKLRTIYGNLYIQRTYNKLENKTVEKIGWDTNAVTRPVMLGHMQEEIREGSLQLNDPVLIRECLTFIKNPETGKAEAESGEHDDGVMSCAIGGIMRREEPFIVKKDLPRGRDIPTSKHNAGMRFAKT